MLEYDPDKEALQCVQVWAHPEEVWDLATHPSNCSTLATVHSKGVCAQAMALQGDRDVSPPPPVMGSNVLVDPAWRSMRCRPSHPNCTPNANVPGPLSAAGAFGCTLWRAGSGQSLEAQAQLKHSGVIRR